jgi:5,10-methylenetetrahydromethanopterin reductase
VTRLGVIFTADRPSEALPAFAAAAEAAGLDELSLGEDGFLAGGIASSATALAATRRPTVGLGVMPAVSGIRLPPQWRSRRSRAFIRAASLPRSETVVPAWMEQIGALADKPVGALEETASAIRSLLAGERVSTTGDYVNLRDAQLEHAPADVPPVGRGDATATSIGGG